MTPSIEGRGRAKKRGERQEVASCSNKKDLRKIGVDPAPPSERVQKETPGGQEHPNRLLVEGGLREGWAQWPLRSPPTMKSQWFQFEGQGWLRSLGTEADPRPESLSTRLQEQTHSLERGFSLAKVISFKSLEQILVRSPQNVGFAVSHVSSARLSGFPASSSSRADGREAGLGPAGF